jgi:hypothetical protein
MTSPFFDLPTTPAPPPIREPHDLSPREKVAGLFRALHDQDLSGFVVLLDAGADAKDTLGGEDKALPGWLPSGANPHWRSWPAWKAALADGPAGFASVLFDRGLCDGFDSPFALLSAALLNPDPGVLEHTMGALDGRVGELREGGLLNLWSEARHMSHRVALFKRLPLFLGDTPEERANGAMEVLLDVIRENPLDDLQPLLERLAREDEAVMGVLAQPENADRLWSLWFSAMSTSGGNQHLTHGPNPFGQDLILPLKVFLQAGIVPPMESDKAPHGWVWRALEHLPGMGIAKWLCQSPRLADHARQMLADRPQSTLFAIAPGLLEAEHLREGGDLWRMRDPKGQTPMQATLTNTARRGFLPESILPLLARDPGLLWEPDGQGHTVADWLRDDNTLYAESINALPSVFAPLAHPMRRGRNVGIEGAAIVALCEQWRMEHALAAAPASPRSPRL